MHYESKLKSGKKIHQCIVPENNMIGIYKGHVDRGYYYFGEDRKYKVKFILTDLAGNETIIDINVKGEVPKFEPASELKINPNQVLVKAGTEQDISIENQFEAHFEKESLFESAAIKLKKGSKINGSDVFELGSMYMPINQKMSIRINASNFQDSLKNRLIVMRKTGSKTLPLKSQLNDNWVETASGDFGDFWLAADTVAPSISHIQTATKYKVVKKGRKKMNELIKNELDSYKSKVSSSRQKCDISRDFLINEEEIKNGSEDYFNKKLKNDVDEYIKNLKMN
jgi:hypothetical protein